MDELFRDNAQRVREAVDAKATINHSLETVENNAEISGKVAPSQERLLLNLPQRQLNEEPLGF